MTPADSYYPNETIESMSHYIVMESRLPNAITALLTGAALATSGLLLQTAFRNPLAGPDVFGISSGAALAVAVVMLAFGGNISIAGFSIGGFLSLDGLTIGGFLAILISAFAGAMLVMGIITLFSAMVRNQVVLLIIGIMVGYLASSGISLLNFFSSAEGMKSYMIWGMGNMGNVSMAEVPYFATVTLIGLLLSLLLVKPLNALLLGEQYAENLGFNIRRLRIPLSLHIFTPSAYFLYLVYYKNSFLQMLNIHSASNRLPRTSNPIRIFFIYRISIKLKYYLINSLCYLRHNC
jgi:iron complex transport system permease protein